MADENKSQSKGIGELFVEFGTKGLPTFLKQLNSVSATFLLTKHAGEQLLKPIKEMYKESGNTAFAIGKMTATLGASFKEVAGLQAYFSSKGFKNGELMGDVNKLMDTIYDLQNGLGGLDGKMNFALSDLGIDIWEYNEGLEGTLDLLTDIQKATANMSTIDRQARLRLMGLSPELGYLFERGNFNKSEALTMTKEQGEKIIKALEAENEKELAQDYLKNTVGATTAPLIEATAKETANMINGAIKGDANAQIKAGGVALMGAGGGLLGATLGAVIGSPLGIPGIIGGIVGGGKIGGELGVKSGTYTLGIGKTLKQRGNPTGFAANLAEGITLLNPPTPDIPVTGLEAGLLPPSMSNITNSITNNNEFNISGSNAQEIADSVYTILDEQSAAVQALRYNQFQAENPPRL